MCPDMHHTGAKMNHLFIFIVRYYGSMIPRILGYDKMPLIFLPCYKEFLLTFDNIILIMVMIMIMWVSDICIR